MASTPKVFFPSMVQSQVSEMRCVGPPHLGSEPWDEPLWKNFNKAFEKMN